MPVAWVGTCTHVCRATHRSRHRLIIKVKIHVRKGCSGRPRRECWLPECWSHFGTLVHQAKGTIRLVPSGISRQSGYSMERWLWTISGYLRFEGTELRKLEQKEETRQRDKQLRIPWDWPEMERRLEWEPSTRRVLGDLALDISSFLFNDLVETWNKNNDLAQNSDTFNLFV